MRTESLGKKRGCSRFSWCTLPRVGEKSHKVWLFPWPFLPWPQQPPQQFTNWRKKDKKVEITELPRYINPKSQSYSHSRNGNFLRGPNYGPYNSLDPKTNSSKKSTTFVQNQGYSDIQSLFIKLNTSNISVLHLQTLLQVCVFLVCVFLPVMICHPHISSLTNAGFLSGQ